MDIKKEIIKLIEQIEDARILKIIYNYIIFQIVNS